MAVAGCSGQRILSDGEVGAPVQQQPGKFEAAVQGCTGQRGVTAVQQPFVWVGTAVQQKAGHLEVTTGSGTVQRVRHAAGRIALAVLLPAGGGEQLRPVGVGASVE